MNQAIWNTSIRYLQDKMSHMYQSYATHKRLSGRSLINCLHLSPFFIITFQTQKLIPERVVLAVQNKEKK